MLRSIRGVIFDLDGLVIDSEITYQVAWREALLQLNHEVERIDFEALNGCDAARVEASLRLWLGVDFDWTDFSRLSAMLWQAHVDVHGIPVKPGVQAVLTQLRRLRWPYRLATNSRRSQAVRALKLAGLEHAFPNIVARDDAVRGKPAPDIFRLAARQLGFAPQHCLVLEDSLPGWQASQAAGMPCCLIPSSPWRPAITEFQSSLILDDLEQLAERLRRLSV